MEFAPLERRPESANPQLSQGLAPQGSSETPMLPENRIDYSQIPPAFQRSFSLGELPTSPPERMQGQPNGAAPAPAPTLLAQSIALPAAAGAGAGAAGVGTAGAGAGAGVLGVIGAGAALIWGGPLAQPTGDATLSGDHAQRMRRQQVLQSTHDHGGGKNAQHGKAKAQPSKEQQVEALEKHLEELKRTQGSKKEKNKTKDKIENIKKEIAKDAKGTAHNNNAKGSNGQAKR
jgi:hypothetical protein